MAPKTAVEKTKQPGDFGGEQIAAAIVDISAAANRLMGSGLKERAIILLIADDTSVSYTAIRQVLHSLSKLRAVYTTLPQKAGK